LIYDLRINYLFSAATKYINIVNIQFGHDRVYADKINLISILKYPLANGPHVLQPSTEMQFVLDENVARVALQNSFREGKTKLHVCLETAGKE